ncbi:hypothetical protein [Paraburkholderia adhaesiva]|uniref:hypothetical protein n=1 Tax=Paraburkholderia adhaesiva TaxID=2883244 RepID=UPI001F166EEC|nr:hypothetical protein [Paraburkholderia adhaesiva]
MATAGSLIFDIAADVAHLRRDMKQASDVITQSLQGIQKAARFIGIGIGVAMIKGLVSSIAESVQAVYDQASALNNLSQRIGTTAEELAKLQYAAKLSNVDTEALTTGFRFLNKALLEARDPSSKAAAAITSIGLSVDELRRMDPAQAMRSIAGAMSQYQDGMEKGAVATTLFGRGGQELIPLLNTGAQGFDEAAREAENFGLVLTNQAAQAMVEFNNQLTRISALSQGVRNQLAVALLPALEELAKWFLEGASKGSVLQKVFDWIAETAILTAAEIQQITGRVQIFSEVLRDYGRAAKSIFNFDWKGAGAAIGDIWEKPKQGLAELDSTVEQMKNRSRQRYKDLMAGVGDLGTAATGAGGKVLRFSDALDKAGGKARAAKQPVDEFARMLKTLEDELRKTAADGDKMMEMLTDPKFLAMTDQQQESLIALRKQIDDLIDDRARYRKEMEWQAEVERIADENYRKQVENMKDFASATLDALDPTREYTRTIEQLVEALEAGYLNTAQFAAAQQMAAEKLEDARKKMDPMKKQLDELKDAILGYGKQATDTFIDFISGASNSSKSFGEMTASILRDIAKMLVYKNIIEPLFKGIGGGGGIFGGLFGSSAALPATYGGQRAAGGAVYPGQLYRVNEFPFLSPEIFTPSVPGRVERQQDTTPMNVQINVYAQTGETDVQGDNARAVELGKRMAAVARQVISNEKRAGGLLAGA